MSSFPEYNSTILSEGSDNDAIANFFADPQKPFLNRAINGLYTPGSVIKPFIAIAALNENIIDPKKEILSSGSISVPNLYFPEMSSIFTDWRAHGLVNMIDALAVSSNIYFYHIGGGYGGQIGLGIEKIEDYLRKFGLAGKTGIDLPVEAEGTIPNPTWKKEVFSDDWRLGDTYNTVIGQYGFQVTPIQILRGIAAIANGGILLKPKIAMFQESNNFKSTLGIKDEAFEIVREGMRQAVERGTAAGLSVPYLKVAAKTGTAEIGKISLNSWVAGFFPYENPKYAFVVIMEKGPIHNSIGGVYVMRQLLDWMNLNTPEYFE
jgi:penicillin-binding protein 2